MTIQDLLDSGHFEALNTTPFDDREIIYLRSCDLLSWVMAKGGENEAWITVQSHSNIIAVATLLDLSCVILPENVQPDPDTLEKANENGLALLSTRLDAYRIFLKLQELGLPS